MILRYIIFFTAFFGVMGIGSYSIYEAYTFVNVLGNAGNNILLVLLITMPILFILTTLIGMKRHFLINDYLYTLACIWLPILLYLFLGSVVLTILMAFIPATSIVFYTYATYFIIAISIGLSIYGLINAHIFNIKNITIPKENRLSPIWSGKKIILVSDTHIGIIHKKNFLTKVVNFINKQNTDMILFAGDLVDGPKFPIEKYLQPLKNLSAPLGIYYTPGNHEIYAGNQKDLYDFTDKFMTPLRDDKTIINGTQIMGLVYDAAETPQAIQNRLRKINYDPNTPAMCIIHTPKNNLVLQNEGIDLTVSGHSHGGQIWPITWGAKKMFKEYIHGLNIKNNKASITTTGIGTWGPPVRIGTKPEIIVISFE